MKTSWIPNAADKLATRRYILDWRDRQIDSVADQLQQRLNVLYRAIDQKIDETRLIDILNGDGQFGQTRISPIFQAWLKFESDRIISRAQKDLDRIYATTLERDHQPSDLSGLPRIESIHELLTTASAASGALALTPFFMKTTLLSATGILGLLGFTTTSVVVYWPAVVAAISLLSIGALRAANLKARVLQRYKKHLYKYIHHIVIGDAVDDNSACQRITQNIKNAADKALSELGV